jgi:hypothetical protein
VSTGCPAQAAALVVQVGVDARQARVGPLQGLEIEARRVAVQVEGGGALGVGLADRAP